LILSKNTAILKAFVMPPNVPPQIFILLAVFSFVMGSCIGSFLNVVIYRMPLGISVGQPRRSFCPLCKYQIPMWLNIPLVSWLMLRGKCANCQCAIPMRYWSVELLTAMLFLAVYFLNWSIPATSAATMFATMFAHWLLLSLFIAGTFIDLEHFILPDEITLGGAAAGLVASAAIPEFHGYELWWQNLAAGAVGAAFGYALVWLIVKGGKLLFGKKKLTFENPVNWDIQQPEGSPEPIFTLDGDANPWTEMFSGPKDRLILNCPTAEIDGIIRENVGLTISEAGVVVSADNKASEESGQKIPLEAINHMKGSCSSVIIPRDAMGFGDVKFMALVGAFLAWKGVLFTIFAASVIGSVISVLLIAIGRRESAQKVPFGPYLALGATIYLFFGKSILAWYLSYGQSEIVE
jgi:leader peptidase (prepilin peptidase)/N-methyltransferase